jgi:hypothetical protein
MIAFLIGFVVVGGVLFLGYLVLSLIWEAITAML